MSESPAHAPLGTLVDQPYDRVHEGASRADIARDMARVIAAVERFERTEQTAMSRECARIALAKLPAAQRTALLAHHKRATTIRQR